ncbi:MAG: hypothetical protein OWQ48_04150 [Desulfurococcus sp.]|nr:hypothetical protein [Desulfurococcus sp.]
MNQGVFTEYMEPRYKDMDLFDFYDDLALRVVIKHENVTESITYAPSKERYISFTFLYKNLSLLYNPDGKVVDYRWVYPLRFWGAILKLELSNGRYLWILFWGDVKYDENVDPYSIDIGYYSPEGPVAIDVKQMLLFIAVIVLPIVLTAYYVLRRR